MSTLGTSSGHLKSDVIGLVGAATLGMVFLSPAMTLYGLFGPIFLACGKAAPLSFVFALVATLPTAFSYAVLSRDFPSSGSTTDWSARATGARMGAWAGWLVFLYYLTNFVIQVVAVGLFFNELLLALSIVLPAGVGFTSGVLLGCAWPAWMVYRGLSISAKGALAFLLIEILTVTALCITVVWVAPRHGTPVTLEGFSLSTAAHNRSGMFDALYILVQSFFIELWAQPWATGKSVVVFDVICALIALVVVLLRNPAHAVVPSAYWPKSDSAEIPAGV